jgi:hypothetical protein
MTKHGGARPGSGAKPKPPGEKKKSICLRIAPDLIRYLDTVRKTKAIEDALRESEGYREYRRITRRENG